MLKSRNRIPKGKRSSQLQAYHDKEHTAKEKAAQSKKMKSWWNKNKDRINKKRRKRNRIDPKWVAKRQARDKATEKAYPERKMFVGAKGRAKKRGIEFNITYDDILPFPTHCPVLGLLLRKGIRTNDPHSYSLDRIDNSKGYIKGNVVVMSFRANRLKGDASLDELVLLSTWAQAQTRKGI